MKFLIIQRVRREVPVEKWAKLLPLQFKYLDKLEKEKVLEVCYHLVGQQRIKLAANINSDKLPLKGIGEKHVPSRRTGLFSKRSGAEFLEITTAIGCPVNCERFCPQEALVRNYHGSRVLSFENFKRLLATVPENVVVHFSGFCEPFANNHFLDFVEYAHEKGHKIQVYTTLFNAKRSDVERLLRIPLEGVCLHLNDGKNVRFPLTQEYYENVFAIIHRVPNTTFSLMNALFTSNNRENITRGILPKPRRMKFCYKLRTPEFVVLPNGDVQLCCVDYGLRHKIGNLLDESYTSIRQRFMQNRKNFSLCVYCDLNAPIYLYYGRYFMRLLEWLAEQRKVAGENG